MMKWSIDRVVTRAAHPAYPSSSRHQHMPGLSKYQFALALLFIAPALWSVNYLVARTAPGQIEPHALALIRWLVASFLFGLGHWGAIWAARAELLRDWKHYVVLGALGMWICGAWVYIGGRTTVALNIALIYSMAPVLIFAASAVWLKEHVTWSQAAGVLLALAGVLHVVLKGQWLHLADIQFVVGDAWIVGAALAWTAYSLLLKRWQSPLEASPRLAVIALAGAVVLLPFAAFEAATGEHPIPTWTGVGLSLAAALFPGYGAYLAFSVMQRELGAAKVSVVQYLGPIYAAVIAWIVLGEPIAVHHIVGLGLILPGIYLVSRRTPA